MTALLSSAQVRASFLDFFRSKQHLIVPSASLMPTSPNLLFTNAGMNQFVPSFLGERAPAAPRIADTQKCIRAGGKHNDLDDVGYDTYHQTLFEMLGNWSFGDYFKQEAIEWAWELLTQVWKFPKERLYATVYQPGDGDPAAFDHEAHGYWKAIFEREGLDPQVRIRTGGKKDNFWMMGETGPCGPCSEIHIDLTPGGDSGGELVNRDSPFCIEIWNLVFIQFNATEDGRFEPLAARHVDTGMGFERVAGIMATTRGFTDFSAPPSNYNSDLFTPIFDRITDLCGQRYGATLPARRDALGPEEMRDVSFRVVADHIRTLSCAIADGILPGNEGRNYVLRRILRRAVMYGRRLHLPAGFFAQLVDPVVGVLGPVFPELAQQHEIVRRVIASEESAFDRTLDRGMQMLQKLIASRPARIEGRDAFELYDTYGFPLDLTQILAEEHGLDVDAEGFAEEMEAQRARARAAQQKTVIRVAAAESGEATRFVGYAPESLENFETTVQALIEQDGKQFLVTPETPFYAEMGGQVGDTGWAEFDGRLIAVVNTTKDANGRFLHQLAEAAGAAEGRTVRLSVDRERRAAIQRHHTATHVIHWALREQLGRHIRQAGSFVGPDRLRFDFSHFEQVQPAQLAHIERACNQRLLSDDAVQWYEVPFDQKPEDVIAFFGEKYGNVVRVVDLGGWSKELCGGTHVSRAGEIGPLRIVAETSVAAGVRRIEAVCGEAAIDLTLRERGLLRELSSTLSVATDELPARLAQVQQQLKKLEKTLKEKDAAAALGLVDALLATAKEADGIPLIAADAGQQSMDGLRTLQDALRAKFPRGVIVLGAADGAKAGFIASISDDLVKAGLHAGKLIGAVAKIAGGGGNGQPHRAQAGGRQPEKIGEAIAQVPALIASTR